MTFTDHNQPNDKVFAKLLAGVILFLMILALGLFGGCKSAEKKQAKMYGKFDKLKRKADSDSVLKVVPSKWSLANFPIKLSGTKTVYLPSRPKITHDTVTNTSIKNDTTYITKYVTKYSHSVDTLQTTDTILDNRPLTQLQADYRALDTKLIQSKASEQAAKDKLSKRTGVMWWLIVAVVVLLLWTFRKLFGFIR
jgi:hypothetical protein